MLYTVNTNEDGYIISISHSDADSIMLDLDSMDLKHLNAYKLLDGAVWFDEIKLTELIAEEQADAVAEEITDLKRKLADTDYIITETFEDIMALDNSVTFVVDFIRIIKNFSEEYADIIALRKQWRARIKELEK